MIEYNMTGESFAVFGVRQIRRMLDETDPLFALVGTTAWDYLSDLMAAGLFMDHCVIQKIPFLRSRRVPPCKIIFMDEAGVSIGELYNIDTS